MDSSSTTNFPSTPVVLTIAGSDSGCNAGIQADIKTISACGAHPTSVITCLTAQNPQKVSSVFPIKSNFILDQLQAVFDYFPIFSLKTGMLYNIEIIQTIAKFFKELKKLPPLVIDPVMIASSGAKLLSEDAIYTLKNSLIPLAELITPNLDEATVLLNSNIPKAITLEDLQFLALALTNKYNVNVLLKGGHLNSNEIHDVLVLKNKDIHVFSTKRIQNINTHGSGCTLSSAIASFLAQDFSLPQAVERARSYLLQGMKCPIYLQKEKFINHMHTLPSSN